MANHPSILAWEIPWTEEPGGPQSMRSQRAGHDRPHTHTGSGYTSGLLKTAESDTSACEHSL